MRVAQEQNSATKKPRSRLHDLVSLGSARALTHHPDPKDTTHVGPAINYSRGHRITVAMLRDRIERVTVAGKADGVHLEPRPLVVADSVKTPPPTAKPALP